VADTFHGVVRGTVDPAGPGTCVVGFSADSPSLVLAQVVPIVALGAELVVEEASPEVAVLIADVGERLTRSFGVAAASAGPGSD
jgi:hypothetical protein